MIRNLLLALAFLAGMVAAAQAQFGGDYPDLSMDALRNANMALDNMAMNRARDFSVQWYLERRAYRAATGDYGYIPGPVTTADLMDSNRRLTDQYERNNINWRERSIREAEAAGRVGREGMMGIVPHYHPGMGGPVHLPYGPTHYNIDNYDVARPGYMPGGFNVQPFDF